MANIEDGIAQARAIAQASHVVTESRIEESTTAFKPTVNVVLKCIALTRGDESHFVVLLSKIRSKIPSHYRVHVQTTMVL